MKINYQKKFDLKNKLAFVAGGSGYIGKEIINGLISMNCKVVVLDIYNLRNDKIFFEHVDLSKTISLERKLKKMFKKYGVPQIFINASYPKTKDWKKNSFKRINLESFETNIVLPTFARTHPKLIVVR